MIIDIIVIVKFKACYLIKLLLKIGNLLLVEIVNSVIRLILPAIFETYICFYYF